MFASYNALIPQHKFLWKLQVSEQQSSQNTWICQKFHLSWCCKQKIDKIWHGKGSNWKREYHFFRWSLSYSLIPQYFFLWENFICWDVFWGLYMLIWDASVFLGSFLNIKSPYQWINPKNVTSINKSTSQGIMLRNWGGVKR